MTVPPFGQEPPQLSMTVSDVFHIRGRGTVVTGRLEGNGPLNVGDTMVCNGARWKVGGIEQFRATMPTAWPGSDIGVLLKGGPAGDALRGQNVQFETSAGAADPQFTVLAPKRKRWRG